MADSNKEFGKEVNMERLIEQVGGRFKLTTLIQKRIKQLNTQRIFGQRQSDNDTIDEVLREIAAGKIELSEEASKEETAPEAEETL